MKRKHGLTPIERVERRKTVTRNECWETDFVPTKVYPSIKIGSKHVMVHRLAYEAYVGPIPDGLYILHKCDNPRCHNPDHLFLGTIADNVRDMCLKGRQNGGSVPTVDYEKVKDAIQKSPHLTQKNLAEKFNCNQSTISYILRSADLARGKGTWNRDNPPVGTKHPRAKFTEDQIRAVRKAGEPRKELAARYGVSISTIEAIQSRRNWAHVPD